MHIRPLTARYAVSPQISVGDVPQLKEAGYTCVICNRPDVEVGEDQHAKAIQLAVEAAGLSFVEIPITHAELGPELAARQADAIETSDGPVLAYCASGTRSTIVWMLGAAASTPPDELLATAQSQGYELSMLRPQLEALYHGAS